MASMAGRVVLVDVWGQVSDIEPALAPLGIACEQHATVPSGAGIVGLIIGPDHLLDPSAVAALPDLRCVSTPSTGYDHLALAAISAAGAYATHVASYCDDEVADHAIAMVVDLLRGVTLLDRDVRAGGWDFTVAHPRRIAGTMLGIVGMGRIGSAVAARATALGMRVVAYDPLLAGDVVRSRGAEPLETVEELFAASSVVSLHALLTDATRGLVGAVQLAAMAPGGFLVNCARAGIVDHDALSAALRSGHLAGAALDVVPTEPPAADDPVLRFPNTIINPHAAFASPASVRAPYVRASQAVAAVLRGDEPTDVIGRPA
jgi:D-3-phosphoglycerate dehydrogenase